MKNVFLIHGYNGIPKIFDWLKLELEKLGYDVIMPEFPPREGAIYNTWKKILNQFYSSFNEDSIVVAHSIGNPFIIKYVNEYNKTIDLYISLAGFAQAFETQNRKELNRALNDFELTKNELESFKDRCSQKVSIYSDNDHIVPFEILNKYPKYIGSKGILIKNIGHMGKKSGIEKIPEVLEIIKNNYNK